MRRVVAALIVVACAALAWPEASPPVCADCRHTCDAGESHDAKGCCHKRPKVTKKKKAKKTKKGKKSVVMTASGPDLGAGSTVAVMPAPASEKPRHKDKSIDELVTGCQNGSADDCNDFVLQYDGVTPELDDGTLASMYTTACSPAHPRACVLLGMEYENGKGVSQDWGKAQELYEKACNKNDEYGCHALGRIYYLALGVVKDVDRAIKLFKRACDAGMVASCSDIGYAYQYALDDPGQAVQWYITACDQGSAVGCANAAGLFSQAGMDDQAVEYRQKACTAGDANSC
jgi:hypothetical protein